MMMETVDVIIAGGGMVGASLACALSHTSLRIAIVEKVSNQQRIQNNFDTRAIALAYSSQRIFRGIGLWETLAENVVPIEKIHVSDRGHFGSTRLSAEEKKLEALGYVIEAQHLNQALQQHCQTVENIQWLAPATIVDLEKNNDQAIVTMEYENKVQKISAKCIVAADGSYSSVRQLAGISASMSDYKHSAIVATLKLSRSHDNTAYERFTAEGPLALLPLSDNRVALVWSVPKDSVEHMMELTDPLFLKQLQSTFGYRLGRFIKIGKRHCYPLSLIQAKQQISERTVLIGNASHTLHPIAGQGFNLGLRDVAMLAQVFAEAYEQQQDIGRQRTLEHYSRQRERDQQQIIRLSDSLVHLFSNDYRAHSVLRDLGLIAVDRIHLLRNLFLKQTMGFGGELSDLASGIHL